MSLCIKKFIHFLYLGNIHACLVKKSFSQRFDIFIVKTFRQCHRRLVQSNLHDFLRNLSPSNL